jgi:hypothetical protein
MEPGRDTQYFLFLIYLSQQAIVPGGVYTYYHLKEIASWIGQDF